MKAAEIYDTNDTRGPWLTICRHCIDCDDGLRDRVVEWADADDGVCDCCEQPFDAPHAAVPSTNNEEWGFYGSMGVHAQTAWPMAIKTIAKATGEDTGSVLAFLDSRHGRHFAHDVRSGLAGGLTLQRAINAVTRKWMSWDISGDTAKQYGIPRGIPFLTGFVVNYAIAAEADD